jgi:hypothetical protein
LLSQVRGRRWRELAVNQIHSEGAPDAHRHKSPFRSSGPRVLNRESHRPRDLTFRALQGTPAPRSRCSCRQLCRIGLHDDRLPGRPRHAAESRPAGGPYRNRAARIRGPSQSPRESPMHQRNWRHVAARDCQLLVGMERPAHASAPRASRAASWFHSCRTASAADRHRSRRARER